MSDHPNGREASSAEATDWATILERIEAARVVLVNEWVPTSVESQAILRARAKALAAEAQSAAAAQASLNVLRFSLGAETYAIELTYVREVYPLKDLTPLPGAPGFVLGIINFRGQILSIIDLKHLLDLPATGLADEAKVLIVQDNKLEFGIAVDAVVGVRMVPISEMQSLPSTLNGSRAKYLQGVTSDHLIIMAADKLLRDADIIVDDDGNG